MLRKVLTGSGAALVLFHVWLLAGQAWNGDLADAALLGRWTAAGGLLMALRGLHRDGASLVRGRKAVAVWLFAALLHAPAIIERTGAAPIPAVPEAVSVLASFAAAGAIGLSLALLTGTRRTLRRTSDPDFLSGLARVFVRSVSPGALLVLAPRPPPLR